MENAKKIQNLFNEKGYKTYACGGFVRDKLLGIEPKDIDLATQATPEEAIKILNDANIKVISTGLQHGTVTAVLNGENYEITTFRNDLECDGRHAEVKYTRSIKEDSARRDFTLNSLYMDLNDGHIIDFHGGIKDLENKLIRFVGIPEDRIHEDYLRILRFLRFQARYGFRTIPSQYRTILEMIDYVQFVSSERIKDEVCKIVTQPYVDSVLGKSSKIDSFLFPELKILISSSNWKKVCCKLAKLNTFVQDPIVSLSFIFIFGGSIIRNTDPSIKKTMRKKLIEKFLYRLKFSNEDMKRAIFILENTEKIKPEMSSEEITSLLDACDDLGNIREIINIIYISRSYKGSLKIKSKDFIINSKIEVLEEKVKRHIEEFIKPLSPLNGNDLISLGFPKGPLLSEIKKYLKDSVIEGKIGVNDKDNALNLLKNNYKYCKFIN